MAKEELQRPLPSNIDEAAEEFAIENCEERMGVLDLKGAFKAGAEWLAGQGETLYDTINVDGKKIKDGLERFYFRATIMQAKQ